MAVSMRLKRFGKKGKPTYRIVVADKKNQRDGKTIEDLGIYNPVQDPIALEIKKDRVQYWISVGAQPTKTVLRLLAQLGVVEPVVRKSSNLNVAKKDRKKESSDS